MRKLVMKKILSMVMVSLLTSLSFTAQAHKTWILPSETILGGDNVWVTFDWASSENIFHIDSNAPRVEPIDVLTPDGKTEVPQNLTTGKLRTNFDVNLTVQGTYKIALASSGLMARWETADGKRGFWPERGAKANPDEFATAVPKDAKKLEVTQTSRRVETFVTLGVPSRQVLRPTNQGLELVPVTHPNDLLLSEPTEFKFLIDGKPAVGAKITIIAGSSRYRNSSEETALETDKTGSVKIEWKKPGMYWLGASYKDNKAQKPATIRSGSYSGTFEVLPE